MLTVLVVVLILMFLLGLPTWGFGWNTYGYGPSGVIGLVLVVLLVLFLTHRI